MTTYSELISRFEVFENPPYKKGFERHHIVPVSEQKEPDNRQIYVTPAQHLWCHILYDKEHGTNTAKRFLTVCNKPVEFFTCYELCLAYSYTLRKKREEQVRKTTEASRTPEHRQKMSALTKGDNNPFYGQHHSEETKKNIADSKKGENNPMKRPEARKKLSDSMKGNTNVRGKKWFNDGVKCVRAYECPEGFVEGMLKRSQICQ